MTDKLPSLTASVDSGMSVQTTNSKRGMFVLFMPLKLLFTVHYYEITLLGLI